jgi:AraC-like DNA-binding protein
MNFQTFAPCPALSGVVRCFWTLELPGSTEVQTFRFLPDGCPELMLLLGTPVHFQLYNGQRFADQRAWLLGPMKGYIDWQVEGGVRCVLVKFQPWALAALIGRPAPGTVDTMLPWDMSLSPTPFKPILDLLGACSEVECRLRVEDWLCRHFEGWEPDPDLVAAVHAMEQQSSLPSLPIGLRRLEQKFQQEIGLSPKFYARNMRMHAAAVALREGGGVRLTSLAMEMGYYDQAHFIREFKQFSGLSPRVFLRGHEEGLRLGA